MAESPDRSSSSLSATKKKLLEQRLKGRLGAIRKRDDGLVRRPADKPALASPGQRRIWLLHQMNPDSPNYNISQCLSFAGGGIDFEMVRHSMDEILRRHPVLRTTFALEKEQLMQVVHEKAGNSVTVIEGDEVASLEEAISQKLLLPFDLQCGPLFRVIFGTASDTTFLGFSFHHIIFDEWSTGIFFKEFSTIYNALSDGVSHDLPTPAFDYMDFAYSQARNSESAEMERQLAYWKNTLANPPGPLTLATDRPYPAELTDDGSMEQIRLDGDVAMALKQLAASEGASGFPVFLLGFQILLGIYSRTDDILIGTPVANRRYRESADMIGFFLNTLCLRQDLSADPKAREAIEATRKAYLDAMGNQDVPFDKVLKELAYERVVGRHPLVQNMFVFQQEADVAPVVQLGNSSSVPKWIEGGRSKFDITLFVIEGKEDFELVIEYRTCLFDPTSIRKMLERYSVILKELCSNPEVPVSKLNYMTADDRNQLEMFSRGPVISPEGNRSVESILSGMTGRHADDVAIIEPGNSLTYREMESRVSRMAQAISCRTDNTAAPVGVHIPKSAGAIVALLAIQKAGRAYLPLDPDYPEERIRFMIEDSGTDLVITTNDLADSLAGIPSVGVTTESGLISQIEDEEPLGPLKPDRPAYIIYTSGSSGTPKGVMVPLDRLQHSTEARIHYYPEHPGRFLLIPSLSFDSSVAGIFWTLATGGTLCLPDRLIMQDPEQLGAFIKTHQVESLLCVPTYYREILRLNDANIQSLRMAIVAGESCPPSLLEVHYEKLPHCRLFNEYGPTETTVWSTVHDFNREDAKAEKISIGKPIPNSIVQVIDGKNRLMAPGLPGEICIGGSGVTPGYLNRPEATAQSFQELPSIGRIYRSGDQGVWDNSGNLYFLGRLDDQVKVRGYRIETGEVEEALLAHPDVTAAAVIVLQREGAPNRLMGFVESGREEGDSLAQELHTHLAEHLPEYMIPSRIIALAEMPHLPNGKTDRQALVSYLEQEQHVPVTVVRKAISTTSDSNQDLLMEILEGVLGIHDIKPEDNFFNLGGDSILAIQVVSRAREAGLQLTVGKLLSAKSVGELLTSAKPVVQSNPVEDNPIGALPLTPIQSWLLQKEKIQPDRWNLSVLLDIDSTVTSEELHTCISKLIEHHDALRSAVYRRADGWESRILPFKEDMFHLESLACPDTEEDTSSIINSTAHRLQASMRINEGELVKGAFFDHQGNGGNQLLLVIHHMAVDWVSWKILLEDLESLLLKRRSGQPLMLPDKSISFRTWANTLVEYSESKDMQEEALFWKSQPYEECPRIPLEAGTHADNLEGSEEILSLEFTEEETLRILRTAKELGVTVQAILYGGLARSLAAWGSSEAVLVDLEGHGREECVGSLDTTRTVGWFTSQFPVVLKLKNGITERAFFRGIQAQLDEIPNRGIGFGVLKYLGRHNPEIATVPEPEVTFNYLGKREVAGLNRLITAKEWSIGGDRDGHSRRTAILEVNAYLSPERLIANWSFSKNLHKSETVAGLSEETRSFLMEATSAVLDKDNDERAHPLTDAQSTLLAHHLQLHNRDQGQIQLQVVLEGPIDPVLFKQTWENLIQSFPVLRTTIHWENLTRPIQVIHPEIEWELADKDYTTISNEAFLQELSLAIEEDDNTPLRLTSAPSFRLTLFRDSDRRATLIWTCHHILLDGWSSALILQRMVEIYNQLLQGDQPALIETVPFKEYCEWLSSRPETQARIFWNSRFKGMMASPLLSEKLKRPSMDSGASLDPHTTSVRLEMLESGRLEAMARECQVSPFVILLSTWTILLSELLEDQRVVTGVTVSGRYDRIPGEAEMAGMLANTIPVVANLDPELSFKEWCKEFFRDLQDYRTFDYCSEKQIYDWTGLPRTKALFDCLFVFANQPIEKSSNLNADMIGIADIKGAFTSAYPMTVIFRDWDEFYLDVVVDSRIIDPAVSTHVASCFKTMFRDLETSLQKRISQLRKPSNPFKRTQPVESESLKESSKGGTTPRSITEGKIQEVWQSLFEINPMGLEADFFALGGNSLLATYLIVELQKALDQPLSMEALFRAPNIRSLAQLIDDAQPGAGSDTDAPLIVPIHTSGDKIPLIMIHPLDGDVFQYHLLGKHMPQDQPLFAIRSPAEPFTDMDKMAENYLELVLEHFPDGRFILGGYCFGAGIAFEMLQKMSQRKLSMYPLVAIDFMYLNLVRFRPSYLWKLLREENLHSFIQRIRGWNSKIGKRLGRVFKLKGKGLEPEIEDFFELPELPDTTREQIESHFFLLKARRPKPFYGDVALILSDSVYSRHDRWVGWDRFTKGKIVREVIDVEHTQLMEEAAIGKIATALVKVLGPINEDQ